MFPHRHPAIACSLFCCWIPSGPLDAQPIVPVGSEMQVNTFTTGFQLSPRIVATDNRFVVVWRSSSDGDSAGIAGRRLNSAGQPVSSEFVANLQTSGRQEEPAVVAVGDGFAVVWSDDYPAQSDAVSGIRFRLFDASDQPLTGEVVVNSYGTGRQSYPAIAQQPGGDFIVVWSSDAGGDFDLQGRVLDSSGSPLATDFSVSTFTTGDQITPFLATDGDEMIVAWYNDSESSPGSDNSESSVLMRRIDSLGQPAGADFQVNTYTTYFQYAPSVLADGIDGFVVAWSSFTQGGGATEYDAVLRRFDTSGAPVGSDFIVSEGGGVNYWPHMAADGTGGFVLVWENDETLDDQILAHRMDSSGMLVGQPIALTSVAATRSEAVVASLAIGDFVAVWDSEVSTGTDTDGDSVQIRRFAFDTDEDGTGDPVDTCTDTDGDGFGDPGFPANTCGDDNCPDDSNPDQADADGDDIGDPCDFCLGDNGTGDSDGDGVCGDLDICLGDDSSGDQDKDSVCADRDCNDMDPENACAIFADGFETGDTSAW